jgi:protein TonB
MTLASILAAGGGCCDAAFAADARSELIQVENEGKGAVLAPEDEGRAIDALRFSLASDIVELVVLTGDDSFLQTLREAVGASRRLWHVPSHEKVSDLLVAGGVGILVLDVHMLNEAATVFISQIKRQFPDLVVIAAGPREAETSLARLISDGTIYRFLHKPVSPGRARLFADAAVKRFEEQRKRTNADSLIPRVAPDHRGLWIGGGTAAFALLILIIGLATRTHREVEPAGRVAITPSQSPLLARAAQALRENRLTAPSGDNALELYLRQLAQNPRDPDARAGLAEVHERLLARAENALLEERLDEAATAIETARKAGVERGRVAFLMTQLAKARELHKPPASKLKDSANPAQGPAQSPPQASAAAGTAAPAAAQQTSGSPSAAEQAASLATERMMAGHLLEPEHDNARYYVQEALRADPNNNAAQEAEQSLALALLAAVRSAIDRRDFTQASSLLDSAGGMAAPANIDNLKRSLEAARRQADSDASRHLLQSAEERLQQDHLIEPENDSARYYVTTLRAVDPGNAGLASITQALGGKLIVKARRALALQQYDAARSWLDAAAAIGYTAPEASAAEGDLKAALGTDTGSAGVTDASHLTLLKSVQPAYPRKAREAATQGWVEIDFTVTTAGGVKDVTVHAASPPGVFDRAAVAAISQWRYQPPIKDSKPVEQRVRLRMRFTLEG